MLVSLLFELHMLGLGKGKRIGGFGYFSPLVIHFFLFFWPCIGFIRLFSTVGAGVGIIGMNRFMRNDV